MQTSAASETIDEPPADAIDDASPGLMHRWFVQYNPIYLLSAALVLGGIWVLLVEASRSESILAYVGIPALAEVYAWSLIGGAAVLMKLGLRRPAAMLGLLAVLYQGDLTMHLEISAYMGVLGRCLAFLWVVLFALKLRVLARVFGLRLSRSAFWVPMFGALGLALLPQLFVHLDARSRGTLLAFFILALGSGALWTFRSVESAHTLDIRGRRAIVGASMLWAALALGHIAFWISDFDIRPAALAPVALLLLTRRLNRERHVWVLSTGALVLTSLMAPYAMWVLSFCAAITLGLRAKRVPVLRAVEAINPPESPYREAATERAEPVFELRFEAAGDKAQERLLLGSLVGVYLGIWTIGWSGGAWPAHALPLDLMLAIALSAAFWKTRHAIVLTPLVALALHLSVELGWVSRPQSVLSWGAILVGSGFATLGGSLGISYWLTHRRPALK